MRKGENESYEDWLERIKLYEKGFALQRLAKGENMDIVLEDFSKRITNKMKHALFDVIKTNMVSNFDVEKSRKDYENIFLKNREFIADHVSDE
jgi:glutamyl-tRNA reductase